MTVKKQLTTALQAFLKGVTYARKHGDWRSVKDELPSDDDEVLVVDGKYQVCDVAYYHAYKGAWFTLDGESINVTYWQPLPELPKDDE